MPTLQDITLAHSRRLSEIHRTRDARLAEAQSLRDLELRALPAAARAYAAYDDERAGAGEKQLATDAKAEAARRAAIAAAIDRRAERFAEAQLARRSADVEAVASKRRADEAANRRYQAAIDDLRDVAPKDRARAAQDAERARVTELEQSRRVHDEGLTASQQRYRAAVDGALASERDDSRDGERAYLDAVSMGAAAVGSARAHADQALTDALSRIPEAAEILRSWRDRITVIAAETKEAEAEAFSRFRHDLDALKP